MAFKTPYIAKGECQTASKINGNVEKKNQLGKYYK